MINALAKRYEDDIDLTLAAAELGLKKTEFNDGVADVEQKSNLWCGGWRRAPCRAISSRCRSGASCLT
jgi:hypothetical protein